MLSLSPFLHHPLPFLPSFLPLNQQHARTHMDERLRDERYDQISERAKTFETPALLEMVPFLSPHAGYLVSTCDFLYAILLLLFLLLFLVDSRGVSLALSQPQPMFPQKLSFRLPVVVRSPLPFSDLSSSSSAAATATYSFLSSSSAFSLSLSLSALPISIQMR